MGIRAVNLFFPGADWYGAEAVPSGTYDCGFCGVRVASARGFCYRRSGPAGTHVAIIRICPQCAGPTVFDVKGGCFPGGFPGSVVANVPDLLADLYFEARVSAGMGAYTAAVLVCRKMLMNIAVEKGAGEGESFLYYVEYLAGEGYVPPDGKLWVDYIRRRGNEANHEIALMNKEDAEALIDFVEMLLRLIYDFPGRVPSGED